MYQLLNRETDDVLLEQLQLATSFWSRFVGLQFRSPLPSGRGLLIAPCTSIHTVGVLFPIDVAFLDASGVIVEIRPHVKPCRVCVPRAKCRFVLETFAGAHQFETGMQVAITSSSSVPRILSALGRNA